MLRRILVPLDGSPFGESSLPFALELARRGSGSIELVHVRPASGDSAPDADGAARLRQLAGRIEAETGVETCSVLLTGDVVTELERRATESADLIAMATHGRTGPSRAWLGSLAEALVSRAGVPLLLIRPPEEGQAGLGASAVDHLLIPLDGSAFAEQVLPLAQAVLALGSDARATLLVSVSAEDAASKFAGPAPYDVRAERDRAEAYLERVLGRMAVPTGRRIIVSDSVARAILQVAAEDDVDLIAMATHGRSGLTRLLLGSVADKVLRGTHKPVLLLRRGVQPMAGVTESSTIPAPKPAF